MTNNQALRNNVFIFFFTLFISTPSLNALLYTATSTVISPFSFYTLANSVECHPTKKLFCVTYTQAHRVVIYSYEKGVPEIKQILENPEANLSAPQHALFSTDGK